MVLHHPRVLFVVLLFAYMRVRSRRIAQPLEAQRDAARSRRRAAASVESGEGSCRAGHDRRRLEGTTPN